MQSPWQLGVPPDSQVDALRLHLSEHYGFDAANEFVEVKGSKVQLQFSVHTAQNRVVLQLVKSLLTTKSWMMFLRIVEQEEAVSIT